MSQLTLSPPVALKVLDARLNDWGLPKYQSDLAAGIDLFACIDAPVALDPQAPAQLIRSGLAFDMGYGHMAALVLPRSGLGHKKGLVMGNGTGVIDADYQGEILISAWNRNPAGADPIVIEPGERIAQLLFVPILRPEIEIVSDFAAASERGAGGFGSTGTS